MKNLEYCRRQVQLSMLRAQWWIASATSGHYKQREIVNGAGIELTDEEKLADCMATARQHIKIASDFSETLTEAEGVEE